MHMLPKGVADLGGERWGLHVDYAAYLKPESSQPVIQTTEEFLSYVHKQDAAVQKNGVWIVVTNPDAYSATEKALLDDIKSLSAREKIVLFVCRGIRIAQRLETLRRLIDCPSELATRADPSRQKTALVMTNLEPNS